MGIFKRKAITKSNQQATNTAIKVVGDYDISFTAFNGDLYENDIVRSCIHAIASNAGKLKFGHEGSAPFNKSILYSPNSFMSSYAFIYKVVSMLYTKNNVFISIKKAMGRVVELIPVDYIQVEFSKNGEFVYFTMKDGSKAVDEYNNLIHLRRHYNDKNLYGSESITPLTPTLEALNTANEGIINAVKSSARLRGLLKFTQSLRPEDLKTQKDNFQRDYLGVDNDGGIAAVDAKADFQELKSDVKMVDDKQLLTIRDNIYNYFGVNEKIIKSNYNEDEYNAFYSSVIEPLAIQFSQEFTRKLFTEFQISNGNRIIFSAERLTFANNSTKAKLINTLLPLGILSINEARTILELETIDNGDRHLVSLNYVDLSKANEYQLGKEDDSDEEEGAENNSEQLRDKTERE